MKYDENDVSALVGIINIDTFFKLLSHQYTSALENLEIYNELKKILIRNLKN